MTYTHDTAAPFCIKRLWLTWV